MFALFSSYVTRNSNWTSSQAFDLFDTDGEEHLDKTELANAIDAAGFTDTAFSSEDQRTAAEIAEELLSQIGKDANTDKITFSEFALLLVETLAGHDPETEMRVAFKALAHPALSINMEKLRKNAHDVGLQITEEELREMFDEADSDHDGQVFEKEFLEILRSSAWV